MDDPQPIYDCDGCGEPTPEELLIDGLCPDCRADDDLASRMGKRTRRDDEYDPTSEWR
jgi:NMD protein affecting ribosome stability and mRNA decay